MQIKSKLILKKQSWLVNMSLATANDTLASHFTTRTLPVDESPAIFIKKISETSTQFRVYFTR